MRPGFGSSLHSAPPGWFAVLLLPAVHTHQHWPQECVAGCTTLNVSALHFVFLHRKLEPEVHVFHVLQVHFCFPEKLVDMLAGQKDDS